jgi:tRNA/tmRNA/rRNA uracil-C5-methylase (TrmA/RlmC/RlmD family)
MRLVDHAKEFIADSILKGSICIDLTCGNGLDTLFLSETTGEQGKVYSFDIQKEAIEKTKGLINRTQSLATCEVSLNCHSKFSTCIPLSCKGNICQAGISKRPRTPKPQKKLWILHMNG